MVSGQILEVCVFVFMHLRKYKNKSNFDSEKQVLLPNPSHSHSSPRTLLGVGIGGHVVSREEEGRLGGHHLRHRREGLRRRAVRLDDAEPT